MSDFNPKFKKGDRVLLHSEPNDFPPGQCPEDENATVIDHEGDGMYMVEVDEKVDPFDDKLREISEEQMQELQS
jgi:hypothetical protein